MSKPNVFLALFFLFFTSFAFGQAPSAGSAEIEKRVESILSKMTLEEKIDYIGGFNDFYVRAIPRLGVPAIEDVGRADRSAQLRSRHHDGRRHSVSRNLGS